MRFALTLALCSALAACSGESAQETAEEVTLPAAEATESEPAAQAEAPTKAKNSHRPMEGGGYKLRLNVGTPQPRAPRAEDQAPQPAAPQPAAPQPAAPQPAAP